MADINTVVIVSDVREVINQVSSKLVLLRNLDKVQTCSVEEAKNLFDTLNPNVLILHCVQNDNKIINLVKAIRKNDIYKNLPIILINDNCSRETIIEAFDSGISDILFMPIIDYELLIRVIWALKQNEINLSIESKNNFLSKIGVLDMDTKVYNSKYAYEFLRNEIEQTKKYQSKACLMLITQDKNVKKKKGNQELIEVIKKSVRLNDCVIAKDEDKFYAYLQKTKLNGAYSVFERINTNLEKESLINASVVEIQNQKFEDIIEALDCALTKANENSNSLIVASDFYLNEEKQPVEIYGAKEILNNQDNNSDMDSSETAQNINGQFDKNSIRLFNQAYQRKLKVVIAPLFKKYENILKIKKQEFAINSYTGSKSMFSVSSGEVIASCALEYNGIEKVLVRLTILDEGQKRLFETESVDFTVLDYRRVSLILSELIDKFIIVLKRKAQ